MNTAKNNRQPVMVAFEYMMKDAVALGIADAREGRRMRKGWEVLEHLWHEPPDWMSGKDRDWPQGHIRKLRQVYGAAYDAVKLEKYIWERKRAPWIAL